jgi:uncharacterized protein YqhQ
VPDHSSISYGGQAVIEGVMMRGRKYMSVAVRAPSSNIVVRSEKLPERLYSGAISRIPFLRGMILLWDTLGLGMKALMFSADVAMEGEDVQMSRPLQWTTVVTALAFGIGLFFLMPMLLAALTEHVIESSLLVNLIEGLIRLGLLIGYVGLIGLIPDIRRVYAYHGAEHMTIHAFEHRKDLEPKEVAQFPPEHPRCGTAFLLQVVALSILLFSLMGTPDLVVRVASRVLMIPVLAGIAYEILKLSARFSRNPLVGLVVWPGLMLQKLTTRQPEVEQIEVAVAAFSELRRIEAEAESAVVAQAPVIPEGAGA